MRWSFSLGSGEGESLVDGQEVSTGDDERNWAPGRYCLLMKGSGTENGERIQYSGVCGWDANRKQLVETWHASDGLFLRPTSPSR
jgi:hypothetical protein